MLKHLRGAYLVNIARGAIVETDALVETLEAVHLGECAGCVRDSLMNFLEDKPIRDDYVLLADGE